MQVQESSGYYTFSSRIITIFIVVVIWGLFYTAFSDREPAPIIKQEENAEVHPDVQAITSREEF